MRASKHTVPTDRCGVGIYEMPNVLRHSLGDEQNCYIFPDLCKFEESLFNIPLI
jgi:hypothetical protein